LAEAIASHLETLILEGSLRSGDRLLAERELALKLDVSRPSLREALDLLERRRLLETRRGGGTFVAAVLGPDFSAPLLEMLGSNPDSTYDYLEFRCVVEGMTAYFSALRSTEIDREIIAKRFAAMESAHAIVDPTEEADADAAFHLAVYEGSHNIMMLHIMGSLSDMLREDVFYNRNKLYTRKGVRDLLLEQHRAVRDAILSGDAEAARAAAEAHVNFTRTALSEIDKADSRLEISLRRFAGSES
jgi:GntR family transcriptional repressor for pyruvate dehydrogenase complex